MHKFAVLACFIILAYAVLAEKNEHLQHYKTQELKRGMAFIVLSFTFWKVAQYFEKISKIVHWTFGALAIFVFLPFSVVFLQKVSGLVAAAIISYIVYFTMIAAKGRSWDGRDPSEGGE